MQVWPDDALGSSSGWTGDDASLWPTEQVISNAVRGFPPLPGELLPVYPAGPFAAWNRGQPGQGGARGSHDAVDRAGTSQRTSATITPDEFDTDYSLPAVKDPVPAQAVVPAAGSGRGGRSPAPARRAPARGAPPGQDQPGRAQPGQGQQEFAAPGQDRPGRPGRGRRSRAASTKRQPAWLAIAAAVVIIAAVAVVLVKLRPAASPPTQPQARTTPPAVSTSPTPPPGQWGYIGVRKTDPTPLTLAELYPSSFSSRATSYTRAAQAKAKNCRAALIGSALQAAVRHGDCTQAPRATYLSKTAKIMGTIGVFNLKNYTVASNAASKAGKSEFVAPLAAKSGPSKAIGQGTGLEEALVKGHYLVLVWAEATNLNAPKTPAGRHRLAAFMNALIKQTVDVSLSARMVDGKPALAG